MTLFAKLVLFASSYSPLMLIWGLMLWEDHADIAMALGLVAGGSFLFLIAVYAIVRRLNTDALEIASVEGRDGEAMSYIVTYLLPFLGIGDDNAIELVAMLIVLVILAVLYVNSNMVYTNPVINLLGFHLFAVEAGSGKRVMVLSRRDYLPPRSNLRVHMIGNFVGLEAKQRERARATTNPEPR